MLLLFFHSSAAVSGGVSSTEASDTPSVAGTLHIRSALTAAEASDTTSGDGALPIQGALAAGDATDLASSGGTLALSAILTTSESEDDLNVLGTLPIAGAISVAEADDTGSADTFMGGIPLPARPGGGEDSAWERYARERQWQADLRRIIEQAWRIAHGEIDSVTRDVKPPPDLRVILGVLSRRAEARVNEDLRSYVTKRQRCAEDDATAVLLLAA